jgi:protein SCO1/2
MTMLSFRHFRAALFAMLAVAVLALAACSDKPAFKNLDITGSKSFGTDFSLTDHTGKRRTLEDFRGKVVVMFFGYTHCPDVCPTTLAELRAVMDTLGKDADRVQVLFVTVDPERDTQDLLAKYVPAFDPRFIGLRPANEAELKKVAMKKMKGALQAFA